MSEGNVERLNAELLQNAELREELRQDPHGVLERFEIKLTDLEKQILSSEKFQNLSDDDLVDGLKHPKCFIIW